MAEFDGRVAVVTGAASGIGRGLAERCAAEGMATLLADVDEEGLETTRAALEQQGARAAVQLTDVCDLSQVERLAERAWTEFGRVDLVFNNAGVLVSGPTWQHSAETWKWVLGVNLFGAIHGVQAFVPRLIAQGTPSRIVNTASVGGLLAGPLLAPYTVSKFGVVGLSESLYYEFEMMKLPVRVSVLCPGAVVTGIADSERLRPDWAAIAGGDAQDPEFQAAIRTGIQAGMEPKELAEFVFTAIAEDRFWILPDPGFLEGIARRTQSIVEGVNPTYGAELSPDED